MFQQETTDKSENAPTTASERPPDPPTVPVAAVKRDGDKIVAAGRNPAELTVREIMSGPIITGNPDWTLMECSKVMKKNSMIGIHIASTLPPTVVDTIAPTTPIDTIQLHSMPRMNSVSMPAAPYSA